MSEKNIIEIENIIKKKDYDINNIIYLKTKETLIFNAIKKGNLKLVKILVKNGASLNIKNNPNMPYKTLYRVSDIRKIKYIGYKKISDVTPLELASKMQYHHIVEYLKTIDKSKK